MNDASKRAQIASFLWGAVSIRKTERAHRGELTRLRETKTLAELMSLNMGAYTTTRATMTTKITRNETTTRRASSSVLQFLNPRG